jgi:hypothetical protein
MMEDAYGNKVSHCSYCEVDTIDGVDERGLCVDCAEERESVRNKILQEIDSPYWKTNDPNGEEKLEDGSWRMIEFSARPFIERVEQYIDIYLEAFYRVRLLHRKGHEAARAVIDLYNEVAYTCDVCGLWQYTSHLAHDLKESAEENHGDLFGSPCDKRIIVDRYGKIDYAAILAEPPTEYGEHEKQYRRPKRKSGAYYRNLKKGKADAPTTT